MRDDYNSHNYTHTHTTLIQFLPVPVHENLQSFLSIMGLKQYIITLNIADHVPT